MNEKQVNIFFRKLKAVEPDRGKKEKIFNNIAVFIKNNPYSEIQKTNLLKMIWLAVKNFAANGGGAYFWGAKNLRYSLSALLFVFLLGASAISGAAGTAMPGDFLYPVKVNVNERVSLVLASSSEAKTQLQAKFAENRLIEAEKLAIEGKLNQKAQKQIIANLKSNLENFSNSLVLLESKGDASATLNISSDFEATVSGHEKILKKISATNEDIKDALSSLSTELRLKSKEVFSSRDKSEKKIISENSSATKIIADKKLSTAKEAVSEAKKFIEENKNILGPDAVSAAKNNIEISEQKISDGKSKIDADSYGEALVNLQGAIKNMQEAKLLMSVGMNLNITVNPSTDATAKAEAIGKLSAAEDAVSDARKIIDENKLKFKPEAISDAENKLADADNMIASGRDKIGAESYDEALSFFKDAIKITKEVSQGIKNQLNYKETPENNIEQDHKQ